MSAVAELKPAPRPPLKDLYGLGEVPPLGHVPEKMHAWAIRKERHGPPEQSFQLEVLPTWPIGEDEVLQHSNTKHLIFDIPTLIAHLSSVMTLEVGDIISTGTPAGVGLGRTPPRWLKPGDEMVVEVEGLGQLRNPCVAEA